MSNAFTFVILLVTVVTFGQLAQTYMKQRARPQEPNEDIENTLRKIDELEERIKVLERIVTENRYDLKSEIDAL